MRNRVLGLVDHASSIRSVNVFVVDFWSYSLFTVLRFLRLYAWSLLRIKGLEDVSQG